MVTFVSPAKTAEPIEMPFGRLSRVGPRIHALNCGADPEGEKAILGLSVSLKTEKHQDSLFIAASPHPWTGFNDLGLYVI